MKFHLRVFRILVVGAWVSFSGSAYTQDYPSKPIRLIVPSSAGSTSDIVARIFAPELAKVVGQPIVVEVKPGAAQVIGNEYVLNQPADGYTIALGFMEAIASLPATVKGLRFDPLKDIPPFIRLVEGRWVLVSAARLPWNSFNELVARAKENPGKFNWGASMQANRLLTEFILRSKGIAATYVPYAGGAAYTQALLSGELQLGLHSEAVMVSLVDKVHVLAVTGERRSSIFPNVPTFKELGYALLPGISYSLNARAGTPRAILEVLRSSASRALQQPEVKAAFAKVYFEIAEQSPDAVTRGLREQEKLFSDIAKQIGLQPQ